ncbi:biotin transporter BioY [Methylobacterium oryzihabitans]|uniref:Biotin transporter n=1 Tax=Methylobacterium oryzihabitans TaxID=2499852 RepID=A0A437P1L2_9HYPH|nr:biotin transporter BioY [Methylobacterium oryzihabitans]RVU16143.1 BioY family transporter [Methylobacterium oryzihabitans]
MTTRDLVLSALFAALIVALGLIPAIPVGALPVPITPQSLGVMLAGLILGPVRGGLAVALVVLLVVLGLPVLSGGRGGFGVVVGPTGGFLLGWFLGAVVTGALVRRFAPGPWGWRETAFAVLACLLGGIGAVYALGIPWLAAVTGMGLSKAALGSAVFVPGDVVKAVVAALIARGVRRAYPIDLR